MNLLPGDSLIWDLHQDKYNQYYLAVRRAKYSEQMEMEYKERHDSFESDYKAGEKDRIVRREKLKELFLQQAERDTKWKEIYADPLETDWDKLNEAADNLELQITRELSNKQYIDLAWEFTMKKTHKKIT